MMKGVLDFLLGSSSEAEELLNGHVFKIVPMLNPDGVIIGNYRCGLSGNDLNRRWRNPSHIAHPTIFHWKALLARSIQERPTVAFIDLHGHSRKSNVFCYGCETRYWNFNEPCMSEQERVARGSDHRVRPYVERVLPTVLSLTSPIFDLQSCNYRVSRKKESCSRVVAWRNFTRSAFTIEASFKGPDYGPLKDLHMGPLQLQDFGRDLCLALNKVFKLPPKLMREGQNVTISNDAMEMHARIARLITMQLDVPGDTAISKEDRDLMQSVRGSLSDDDESSEDEAIMKPDKLMSHLAQLGRKYSKPPAHKISDMKGGMDIKIAAPTPPVSPLGGRRRVPVSTPAAAEKPPEDTRLSRGPLNSQGSSRRPPARMPARLTDPDREKQEAAARLQELLSNAEQMRAVAKARSAMHPKDCECLLCRAPYLLDAGDVLLMKMKPLAAGEVGVGGGGGGGVGGASEGAAAAAGGAVSPTSAQGKNPGRSQTQTAPGKGLGQRPTALYRPSAQVCV